MPFNYSHTCPDIDREIARAKENIEYFLNATVEELCPMFASVEDEKNEWVAENTKMLYEDLEGCFEAVRKTNEDMRSEAEKQIEAVEEFKDELNDELEQLLKIS